MTTPGPRRRLTAEARRAQLLDVAADLIAAEGVGGLSIDALAMKAGVSRALVYRHVEDSDDVLRAVFDHEMQLMGRRVRSAVDRQHGLIDRTEAMLNAWLDTMAERGTLIAALLFADVAAPTLVEQRRRHHDASSRFVVDELLSNSRLTPEQARIVAAMFTHATGGVVDLWRSRRMSRRRAVAAFMTMFSAAVQAMERTADED